MPELGKKYTCYSCHTKFYDLGKPIPTCPKCGADQRDADDTPVVSTGRGRGRAAAPPPPPPVVEEVEEPEFGAEGEAPTGDTDEEEEIVAAPEDREEEADDEEEEEEY